MAVAVPASAASAYPPVLPLENGDRLTRAEFERRYAIHVILKERLSHATSSGALPAPVGWQCSGR